MSRPSRGLLPQGNWTSGGADFDPADLWFLYVLLVFSLAPLPVFQYLRGQHGTRLTGRAAAAAARHPLAMLAVAAVPVIFTEAVFGPDNSTGGWERLAYLFPFVYGFLIASDTPLESALARARWPALAAAAAATAGLLGWSVAAGPGVVTGAEPGWSALQGLAGWAWCHRRAPRCVHRPPAARPAPRRHGPPRHPSHGGTAPPVTPTRPCSRSTCCTNRSSWRLPGLSSAGTHPSSSSTPLVAASFTAKGVIYELAVRSYRTTRLLFGMKPRQRTMDG